MGGDISYFLQIKSLLGTKVEWLYYILQAFNSGDLVRYQELCHVHNAALRAQPALVENEKKLVEKINILCLMEIIFRFSICLFFFVFFVLPLICARGTSLSWYNWHNWLLDWTATCFLAAGHLMIELYLWVSLQSAQNFLSRRWSIFLWRAFL